jgi:hypothetical protein
MLKILEDYLGITSLKTTIIQLRTELLDSQLKASVNAMNWKELWKELLDKYNALFTANMSGQDQLSKDTKTISDLTARNAELETQLLEGTFNDLFLQSCPALLVEEPNEKKIVLGDFMIKTAQGDQTLTYPQPSATFMPCPIYEPVLKTADCNRPRPDLSEPQIAKKIANVQQLSCAYVTDQTLWGRMDNHTPAVIVARLRRDDCDSLTDNITSPLTYYQFKFGAFKNYSIMRASGHLVYGGNRYGHTFGLLVHNTSTDLKDSYVIESTDNYASDLLPLDKYGINYEADWGVIGFPRKGFEQGAYQVKTPWWVHIEEITSINPSLLERVTGILKHESEMSKEEALKRFAEERKMEV